MKGIDAHVPGSVLVLQSPQDLIAVGMLGIVPPAALQTHTSSEFVFSLSL